MVNQKFNYMMQILNTNGNPQAFLQQKIMQNSNLQQKLEQIRNMQQSSGLSEKDFVMQIYKQNGIEPAQVQQLAQRFGIH